MQENISDKLSQDNRFIAHSKTILVSQYNNHPQKWTYISQNIIQFSIISLQKLNVFIQKETASNNWHDKNRRNLLSKQLALKAEIVAFKLISIEKSCFL